MKYLNELRKDNMRDYTIAEIIEICKSLTVNGGDPWRPVGVPFLDAILHRMETKHVGTAHAYYSVFRAITQALNPGVVMEVGTWEGSSAAFFADGCPTAEVFTIDHHSDPGDDKNLERVTEVCNQYSNVSYIQGCSTEVVLKEKPHSRFVKPILLEQLAGRKIDIFLVDGWHFADMARADYDTYVDLLSNNALIICDDLCGGAGVTISGMKEFFEGLPGLERYIDGAIHAGFPIGFLKHNS